MSVSFDSIDDLISCGTATTLLMFNSSLSISAWIYPKSDGQGAVGRIITKVKTDGSGVTLRLSASSALTLRVSGGTALNHQTVNNAYTVNSWQNVIVTWDGTTTAANAKIYVNGTESAYATTINGNAISNNSAGTIYIGQNHNTTGTFDGYLAEISVWNTIVSTASILTLSSARVKGLPLRIETANLISYWPLDDVSNGSSGDSATFRDRQGTNTGTGNDGTNNTGMLGTIGEPLSYFLQNDKNRGKLRGIVYGGIS